MVEARMQSYTDPDFYYLRRCEQGRFYQMLGVLPLAGSQIQKITVAWEDRKALQQNRNFEKFDEFNSLLNRELAKRVAIVAIGALCLAYGLFQCTYAFQMIVNIA